GASRLRAPGGSVGSSAGGRRSQQIPPLQVQIGVDRLGPDLIGGGVDDVGAHAAQTADDCLAFAQQAGGDDGARHVLGRFRRGGGQALQLLVAQNDEQHQVAFQQPAQRLDHQLGGGGIG